MSKTTNLLHILVFLLLSTFLISINANDEYYIDSTNGSDADGDGSSGSPYATVSKAYAAFVNASSGATEFILTVKDGTYTGPDNIGIAFYVNTTIQSDDNNAGAVIFDCEFGNSPNAFNPLDGSFKITYLTIQNCQRGLNIQYMATLPNQDVLVDNILFNGISSDAIWVQYPSSMSVTDSMFSLPNGESYRAYITVTGNFSAGIDIINNHFSSGSGIQIVNMNGGNINQNGFFNLTGSSMESPPAIYIEGGVWDIAQNTFQNIIGDSISAVNLFPSRDYPDNVANFSLSTNTFENCVASNWNGGAVYFSNCLAEVTDSTYLNNVARWGGAIFATGSNVTVQQTTFTSNNATQNGGAIDIEGTTFLFLYDNDFESNVAINGTSNSLACCQLSGANCAATLLINDKAQGDFQDDSACENKQYVSTNEYFESIPSYPYQEITDVGGTSYWWIWLLVSLAVIATIVVVGVAIGAFVIYTKKKRSYEAFA